jgi:cytochrome P450
MQTSTPEHVPQDLVLRFNIYDDPRLKGDLHQALKRLHRDAPEIFWTPENGGHWVITRGALMEEVLKDHEHFSSRGNHVPYAPDGMVMIPLNLDPPEHTYYRSILMRHFSPPAIKKLEPRVEYWARHLVDRVADAGRCEFMDEVASLFPVSIFMEMMGLPIEHLREYRAIVVEYFGHTTPERWLELQREITRRMREVLDARLIEPRDDMTSKLLRDELDGRKMTMTELEALTNLLFQAGMDTVANFAGFFFRYLGSNPDLQRQIRENPRQIADIVEEGFRLLGVVNNGRMLRQDRTVGGIPMRKDDIIICMLPLAGLDERRNPEPEVFKVNRPGRDHMLFSRGVHLCIGHTLARAEMRVLLAEWFKRIPEYGIAPGYAPTFRAGQVMGLSHLPLEWTPAA